MNVNPTPYEAAMSLVNNVRVKEITSTEDLEFARLNLKRLAENRPIFLAARGNTQNAGEFLNRCDTHIRRLLEEIQKYHAAQDQNEQKSAWPKAAASVTTTIGSTSASINAATPIAEVKPTIVPSLSLTPSSPN